ncbi:hypothetical protein [Nocardia sp. NPDC057030]|uniref:hypothetical protein n=1 Tax=unclassified Nocardia TaxID=2637762 RepID=UPI003641153C
MEADETAEVHHSVINWQLSEPTGLIASILDIAGRRWHHGFARRGRRKCCSGNNFARSIAPVRVGRKETSAMVANLISGTAVFLALGSIIVALRTYREQVRARQTQWLLELRQKMLDNNDFRRIRMDITDRLASAGSKDTPLSSAIRKKRASTDDLTDSELELIVAVDEYLDFFEVLEQLIQDRRLRESDVFVAFNSQVDAISRNDVLAAELVDFPRVRQLIDRHERIFVALHPELVGTPRATRI